jgi:hypothetical protein
MLIEVKVGYVAEMWKIRSTYSCFSGENLLKSDHMEHWQKWKYGVKKGSYKNMLQKYELD